MLIAHVDDFSVVLVRNLQLRQIDLSSLEGISGGGVFSFNNPHLCYVGNLSTYLDSQTTQHQCIISLSRRDPQTCSESCVVYSSTIQCNTHVDRKYIHRFGGKGTAGTAMAVPVFEGEKMASLAF